VLCITVANVKLANPAGNSYLTIKRYQGIMTEFFFLRSFHLCAANNEGKNVQILFLSYS